MADTTTAEQEESLWDQMKNSVGNAYDSLVGLVGSEPESAPDAPAEEADAAPEEQPQQPVEAVEIAYNLDENGSLIVPEIDSNASGMKENQRLALSEGLGPKAMFGSLLGHDVPDFAADGLGYSSGQIDMIDDLARRYDGIEIDGLQGTLVALADNDQLRDNVMDAMMENDQELAHYAAQAFEQDPTLLTQFEDMVRNDPEAVQDMLPELKDNPAGFAEQVRNRGRDAETALAANQEMERQTQENTQDFMQEFLSGDLRFADILGPQIGGWLDNMVGPIREMISGFVDKGTEFVSQNIPEDSPVHGLVEGTIFDAANPDGVKPTIDPSRDPNNTNEVAQTNRTPVQGMDHG